MGVDWNALVCFVFDESGKYLGCEERFFGHDGEPTDMPVTTTPFHPKGGERIGARFDEWVENTIAKEGPIQVDEFFHPSRFIGVEELPGWAQDFLGNPAAQSASERAHLEKLICRWREDGDFVFWWNEDYLCNRDGTVHSH
jgi:hypothetical protein